LTTKVKEKEEKTKTAFQTPLYIPTKFIASFRRCLFYSNPPVSKPTYA